MQVAMKEHDTLLLLRPSALHAAAVAASVPADAIDAATDVGAVKDTIQMLAAYIIGESYTRCLCASYCAFYVIRIDSYTECEQYLGLYLLSLHLHRPCYSL